MKSYADLEGYVVRERHAAVCWRRLIPRPRVQKQNHGQDGLAGSEELTKAEAALESAASLIRS